MRALATGTDGRDVIVRDVGGALPVAPGGVLGAGVDVLALPFGVVEIAVVSGVAAGLVHRLAVGRYRCSAEESAEVRLPLHRPWSVDVRPGGVVVIAAEGEAPSLWPVGERRHLDEVEVVLRWCRGPAHLGGSEARPERGRPLCDLLLERVAGVMPPQGEPVWELGRHHGSTVEVPLAEQPLLVVSGRDRRAYARAVLGRLLDGTRADRMRVTVLAAHVADTESAEWSWVRWLPQARCTDERFVRVGFDDDTCAQLLTELTSSSPSEATWDGESHDVIVIDGYLADVELVARPGRAVLMLDQRGLGSPVEDDRLRAEVEGTSAHVFGVTGRGMTDGDSPGITVEVDLPPVEWADRLARTMTTAQDEPEPTGRLLSLVGVDAQDPAAPAAAWSRPATTRVVIGHEPGGDAPIYVDVRADGPHALIGGTTGSGKSELLQTLVTSLALANAPESMTFLLIDYKGGAAFAACADLPHTVGMVTDLDAALTERALASLSAEIRRRERLLAEARATDIDAYVASGAGAMARLVIVVDEFATLAAELPEFVDGLVDIARRGRSLGLHLVLATQRPAGAVSSDIRANTTLRIALRVADVADSVDVIGVPDAVSIPERHPGRAVIRVGQNEPVTVQVARVTTPAPADAVTPYEFGQPLGGAGRVRTDLDCLALSLTALAEQSDSPMPVSPWLPPLPEAISLTDCALGGDVDGRPGRGVSPASFVPLGWEDHPADQRQGIAVLDLDAGTPLAVVGAARSGRTSVLRTIAASVAQQFAPTDVHVYVIDAGARSLDDLADLPNVGVVAGRDEPDRTARLITRLVGELDRRSQRLALRRWRDVAEQRAGEPDDPWPYLLLLVDRWDLHAEAADASGDRALLASLERLVSEGGRAGMLVVATGDRSLLTGRMTSLFPDRLVLRLADVHDYASLGLPGVAGGGVPGRGWRGIDVIETQVALADSLGVQDETPLGSLPGVASGDVGGSARRLPFRIDPLPGLVTREEASALPVPEPMPPGALTVAVGGDEVCPLWIDADEHGPCALVTGRRRSGRSGALMTLAESALSAGWEVAMVTSRRSPLERLTEVAPGRVHGPYRRDEEAAALTRAVDRCLAAGTRLLVLADDVDLLPEGDLFDVLGGLGAKLRDTGCLFVGAGEAEDIAGAFRGPGLALRRARCGVMLAPQTVEDGDAFGVRLRRGQYGRALGVGAGFLVLDGLPERVQVVRCSYLPEPT